LSPLSSLNKGLNRTQLEQDTASNLILLLDSAVEHSVTLIHSHHGLSKLNGVINGSKAQAASGLGVLGASSGTGLHGHEHHGRLANVHGDGLAESAANDGDDGIIFAGKVVKEHSVGSAARLLSEASSLKRNGMDEVVLVREANKGTAQLDGSLDSVAVGADVADELAKLAGLQDNLAQGLVAEVSVASARFARQVGVKADEGQVVDGGLNVGGAEVTRVVA